MAKSRPRLALWVSTSCFLVPPPSEKHMRTSSGWQNHAPALHFGPPPLSLCCLGSPSSELQRIGTFMGLRQKGIGTSSLKLHDFFLFQAKRNLHITIEMLQQGIGRDRVKETLFFGLTFFHSVLFFTVNLNFQGFFYKGKGCVQGN